MTVLGLRLEMAIVGNCVTLVYTDASSLLIFLRTAVEILDVRSVLVSVQVQSFFSTVVKPFS